MKPLKGPEFDPYRVDGTNPKYRRVQNDKSGSFVFPFGKPDVAPAAHLFIRCIASNGGNWDHVSVSVADMSGKVRTPIWEIMEWTKRRFFFPHEVCYQLHVAEKDHISINDHVLHIWRHHSKKVPLPPKGYV